MRTLSHIRRPVITTFLVLLFVSAGALSWAWFGLPENEVPPDIRIGTASKTGTYHKLGEWLSERLTEQLGVRPGRVHAESTAGTTDNVERLASGRLELAIVQSDAEANNRVSTIGRLYDEFLHIVVNLENFEEPPRTIDALNGRMVGIGPQKSGTRVAAQALLGHYNVVIRDAYEEAQFASSEMARLAFEEGEVDALFVLAAIPSRTVQNLLTISDTALLPVDVPDPLRSRLGSFTTSRSEYSHVAIPAGMYGTDLPERQLDTVAVTALFVARSDLNPTFVRSIAGVLYDPTLRWELARVTPGTAKYNQVTDVAPSAFAYHPGLVQYVRHGPAPANLEQQRTIAYGLAALALVIALLLATAEIVRAVRLAASRRQQQQRRRRRLTDHDVFISYASSNSASEQAVRQITAEFDRLGISYWYAKGEMPAGAQWARVIPDAIRGTRAAFLLLVSGDADASDHCRREVSLASESGLQLVPYFVEDVKPTGLIEYHIAHLHHIQAYNLSKNQALEQLRRDVNRLIEAAPPLLLELDDATGEEDLWSGRRRFLTVLVGATLALAVPALGLYLTGTPSAPPGPTPLTPADGTLQIGGVTNFTWDFTEHQDSKVTYELEIRPQSGQRQTIDTAQLMFSPTDLDSGPMQWRVRAVIDEGGGQTSRSRWSPLRDYSHYTDTLDKIVSTRTVTVAVSEDTLLGVDEEGQPWNAELEWIRLALEDVLADEGVSGLKVEKRLVPWGEGLWGALKDPHIDIMSSNISIRPERERHWGVRFTEPLVSYPPAFVYLREDSVCVGKNVTARSCRIGVRSKTTSEATAARLAAEFDGVTYIPVELQNVYQVMWDRLRTNEYDMLLVDEPYANDMMRSAARLRTRLSVTPVTDAIIDDPPIERIGIAVKPADDTLREALNRGLDKHRDVVLSYWRRMDRNTLGLKR